MGFFDVFKNKKTHEQKMDLAYQCFKPDMVGMLFINGKEQANEVILKLSKILRIDLDGLNEREYYEILQIYAYLFVKIVVQEAGEESAIRGLQISKSKYVRDYSTAKDTTFFFLENYTEAMQKHQNENPPVQKEEITVESNLSLEELYNKGTTFFNNKDYDQSKAYLLEYANKIEEIKKNSSENIMAFSSTISFVLYCRKNKSVENFSNLSYPISSVYTQLAFIDIELNLYDEAEEFLNKALEWDPYNLSAINEKGELYKAKKDLKKYYFNTLDSADMIYKESDLARYYRNLGYYFIENSEWDLAKAVYSYSLEFEFSLVVPQELEYIAQKSGSNETPSKENLTDILKENRIITYISDTNIETINDIYESVKKENQLETSFGKEVQELVQQFEKHKNSNSKIKCKVCEKEIPYNENGTCEECHNKILKRLEEKEKQKDIVENKAFCTQCGKQVENDWNFCNYCGHKIK